MGTRNVTRVISGGATKICQFGYWDGYPTSLGFDALYLVANSDMDLLRKRLENINLVNLGVPAAGYGPKHFREIPNAKEVEEVGKTYDAVVRAGKEVSSNLEHMRHQAISFSKDVAMQACVNLYGEHAWLSYRAAMMDTGLELLFDIIGAGYLDTGTLDVYSYDRLLSLPITGDEEIKGIATLDLDAETLAVTWRGDVLTLPLESAKSLSSQDAMELMDDLQSGRNLSDAARELGGSFAPATGEREPTREAVRFVDESEMESLYHVYVPSFGSDTAVLVTKEGAEEVEYLMADWEKPLPTSLDEAKDLDWVRGEDAGIEYDSSLARNPIREREDNR